MTPADTPTVEDVLTQHQCDYSVTSGSIEFDCGFTYAFDRNAIYAIRNAHIAHIAATLREAGLAR